MSDRLKCAVIGVGYLGRFHAQKYFKHPKAELIGVYDANVLRAREVASELGPQVRVFESIDELTRSAQAVSIAASTNAHYEITKLCFERGLHALVEKPVTSSKKEGEELCRLAAGKGLKFQVGHVERFNPAFVSVKDRILKPLFIEVHRLAPFKPRGVDVDVVFDLMIHDLDVLLSLARSPVKAVQAVGVPVLTRLVDIANARIEFESGLVANITSSRVSMKTERKFRIFQSDQYVSLDFGGGTVNLTKKTGDNWEDGNLPLEHETWSLEKADALYAEVEAFIDSILLNKPCVVSGEDGLKAVELAEMVLADIERRLH